MFLIAIVGSSLALYAVRANNIKSTVRFELLVARDRPADEQRAAGRRLRDHPARHAVPAAIDALDLARSRSARPTSA
jgi:hypothetical protein